MRHISALVILFLMIAGPAGAQVVIPPQLVGSVDTPNDSFDVVLSGSHALVADYASGVQVIDISNPAAPFIAGDRNTPGYSIQTALSGNYAFVADHTVGGMRVLNLSGLPFLAFESAHITGDAAVGVAAAGNLVAVGYLEGYLELVDVSLASQPVSLAVYDTPGTPRHLEFNGERLFVADNSYGLIILDVSDPTSPSLIGTFPTNGRPVGLTKSAATVYLADGMNGLRTIDVKQPALPNALGSVALPGPALKVVLAGAYAIVADHVAGGIQVVDVSNPSQPDLLGGYVTGFYAHGVAVRDELAFLADGKGLQVFRVFDAASSVAPSSHGAAAQLHVFPNPFNPITTIRVTLQRRAPVSLSVFDARGRLVQRLVNESLSDGEHSFTWRGRDTAGHRVASGVYHARLVVGGKVTAHKMVLLK